VGDSTGTQPRPRIGRAGRALSIRDRDSKYSRSFDEVFRSEAIRTVKAPVRARKANAIAERFVRTVRSECVDWLLILNRCYLERVLRVSVDHYNTRGIVHSNSARPRPTKMRDQLGAKSSAATGSAAASSTSTTARPHDPRRQ
jgi:transposase InsO family protein